jgi:hypothetical protein
MSGSGPGLSFIQRIIHYHNNPNGWDALSQDNDVIVKD